MIKNSLFDIDKGRELRDKGIKRAEDHAGAQIPGWSEKAWGVFLEFMASKAAGNDLSFMAEDLRYWAYHDKFFPAPPDGRAWGGVLLRAARKGFIRRIGYAAMKSKNCHANPKSVWEVVREKIPLTNN